MNNKCAPKRQGAKRASEVKIKPEGHDSADLIQLESQQEGCCPSSSCSSPDLVLLLEGTYYSPPTEAVPNGASYPHPIYAPRQPPTPHTLEVHDTHLTLFIRSIVLTNHTHSPVLNYDCHIKCDVDPDTLTLRNLRSSWQIPARRTVDPHDRGITCWHDPPHVIDLPSPGAYFYILHSGSRVLLVPSGTIFIGPKGTSNTLDPLCRI